MAIINGIPIQTQLVSGTNIKTINGSSVLGSGDLVVGGGSSGLLGVHAIMPLSSGERISQVLNNSAFSSIAQTVNSIKYYPFIPNQTIISSGLVINCSNSFPSGLAQIGIYSDLNGLPNTRLFASTNIDCSTSGIKTITTTFTFNAGTIYWFATNSNQPYNLTAIQSTAMMALKVNDTGATPINANILTSVATMINGLPITATNLTLASLTPAYIGIVKS